MTTFLKNSNPLWWKSAVFYQIYPRSFYDSNNDGIGDIPGIIQKLDDLNDGSGGGLGVDALWISPFFPSPMKDFGYDISDYVGIDPIFGSMKDFEELVRQSHDRGMRLVIDLVLNHTSDEHPWFVESKSSRDNNKADWYIWHDGKPDGSVPNNWLSVFGGAGWSWCEERSQYYYHSFLKEQPDINWYHSEVREEIRKVLRFWLEKGVDGFRLDTANFYAYDKEFKDNPPYHSDDEVVEKHLADFNLYLTSNSKDRAENFEFLSMIRETMNECGEHYMTIGEIGGIQDPERLSEISASYVKGNKHLHMAYNFGLLGDKLDSEYLSYQVELIEKRIEDGWPCWSLGNHDCKRLASRAKSANLTKSLLAMLLFLRGTPILYYGDESDMPEYDIKKNELQDPFGKNYFPEYKGRDGCRTPFPWDSQKPNQGFNQGEKPWLPATAPICLDQVIEKTGTTYELLKELLEFRRTHLDILNGSYTCFDNKEGKFYFSRKSNQGEIRFVLNTSTNPIQIEYPAEFSLVLLKNQTSSPTKDNDTLRVPSESFAVLVHKA